MPQDPGGTVSCLSLWPYVPYRSPLAASQLGPHSSFCTEALPAGLHRITWFCVQISPLHLGLPITPSPLMVSFASLHSLTYSYPKYKLPKAKHFVFLILDVSSGHAYTVC